MRLIHKVPGLRRLGPPDADAQGFVPPRPLRDIRFTLPPESSPVLVRTKRMDLKASVDATGRVTRVDLISPRDEDLVTLAAYAATMWHFAPAELDGHPVPGEVILHFDFDASPVAQTAMGPPKPR